MDVDPTVNVSVFQVKDATGSRTLTNHAPTRVTNSIQLAWKQVLEEQSVQPKDVTEIYSEWSATEEDEQFLRTIFPNAQFAFSFERPENEEDWDSAFAKAAQVIAEAERDGEDDDNEDVELESVPGKVDKKKLIPVLRDYKEDDPMNEIMFLVPIGAGLGMALAQVGRTERGTIGVNYLMNSAINRREEIEELLFSAFDNFAQDIDIEARESEQGELVIKIQHPTDHGSSVLCLPDIYEQACEWLKTDRIWVGVASQAEVIVTNPEYPFVESIQQSILESTCDDGTLAPACFILTGDKIERIATKG